ncbi:MAG: TGS domain-containing protein [Terriglobales bacterium]
MSVFTSDGSVCTLPTASTPVDVAYATSSVVGDRCIGARVNGQLAPLSAPLADGDVVEVLTSAYGGPEREWLDFVRSSRAHVRIQQWFAERDAATFKARRAGKRAIVEAMFAAERILMYEQPLVAVAKVMGFPSVDDLYAAVAAGKVPATDVVERVITIVDGG